MEELVVTVPGCTRSKCAGCLLRPNVATCVVKPQGSKVTVIEVDGKALMLAGKLSLSRRAINGGTCGHPCVAWQIFTGPSRRRTSPMESLNTSATPGVMMFWRCLFLSNSHEEVEALPEITQGLLFFNTRTPRSRVAGVSKHALYCRASFQLLGGQAQLEGPPSGAA